MITWHILVPEYPPDCGGVGDYTSLVADALATAGDSVHVWVPRRDVTTAAGAHDRIVVHALPDRFGRTARAQMDSALAATPGVMLVQFVPSAFGWRGSNVPFCRWLQRCRARGIDVRVMFHEPYFYFSVKRPWRNALAVSQRVMAALVVRAARHLYFSTATWFAYLRPYGPLPPVTVLPIPATIAVRVPETQAAAWRGRVNAAGDLVIGHFGSYGDHVGRELRHVLGALARRMPNSRVLLIGNGGREFAASLKPLPLRIEATGRLDPGDAAAALRACDLLMQPYPDGVTTRRTSIMAALSSGRAVVTTKGALTERMWAESESVALVPAGDSDAFVAEIARLVQNADERARRGTRGVELYDRCFAIENTIRALRAPLTPEAGREVLFRRS